MTAVVPRLRPVLLGMLALYILVYPGSTIVVALDRVPEWGTWMGGALLILQGTLMGLWLMANSGWRGVAASCAILLLGWAVEHVGVTTGFPFGAYRYTDALVPKIVGAVPLAIPFAWLLVVPSSAGMADRLLARHSLAIRGPGVVLLVRILVAASLALLLDIAIEPVAVHINGYWTWLDGGGYYGVPLSNFVAWWWISALLTALLLASRQPPTPYPLLPFLPIALYMLNLLMFTLINLAHGQVAAAAIGGLLLGYLSLQFGVPQIKLKLDRPRVGRG